VQKTYEPTGAAVAAKPAGGGAAPSAAAGARPPSASAATPLMRQYLSIKEEHPDEVLFFRLGDFYEMFFEDAETVARVLGIVCTKRSTGPDSYPMAGFPVHAVDRYLPRLIAQGYSVAICEQVEDPATVKGKRIVERKVIEVITPGTLTSDTLLDERSANFLLAVHLPRGRASRACGLAWFEVSSGRFLVAEVDRDALEAEVLRIGPAEVLVADGLLRKAETDDDPPPEVALLARHAPLAGVPDWVLGRERALDDLKERYGVATLAGLGLEDRAPYVPAACAALHYVTQKKPGLLDHLGEMGRGIERFQPEAHLCLDPATSRCLEITAPLREGGGRSATLLGAIDRTRTAMGGRLLREWLMAPLRDVARIAARQDAVAALVGAPDALDDLGAALAQVYDLERLAARAASGRAGPRDLAALRDSLARLPAVEAAALAAAGGSPAPLLEETAARLDPLDALCRDLEATLVEKPAAAPKDGRVIAEGRSEELDGIRSEASDVNGALARFQEREVERTGIPSLKIGFNKVFGYYLEVTQAHRKKVPADYVRKQTLKSCERFLTPELKELEGRILSARDRAEQLEQALFAELRTRVAGQARALIASAEAAARLDVLAGLARLARERGWVRPVVSEGAGLRIEGGRHPVLDLQEGHERFVPNDLVIGGDAGTVHVITGPNMAGKSTYIRQSALLVLLAQTGAFLPVDAAEVGVVDRVFARVGSGDELAHGLSTFMVEMTETANILRHATDRSLVILDEVGRGTSTYDGVSLAWAIAEYLHDRTRARTLFATHYHELTGMAAVRTGVRNMNVKVEERGDEVFFLHRVVPGSADRSYGIHVARLAGVPSRVLARAQVILRQLEGGTFDAGAVRDAERPREAAAEADDAQLGLFQTVAEDALRARLREVEVEATTPLDALALLAELKGLAE